MKDKRKENTIKKQKEKKAKELAGLAPNSAFLQARTEKGELKYPLAVKLLKYKLSDIDPIQDIMRRVAALVHNVRHSLTVENMYKDQYNKEEYYSKDTQGIVMNSHQLWDAIITEGINRYRFIAQIRTVVVDELISRITFDEFTGDMYNDYVLHVEKVLKELGYDLFPEKFEVIFPQ